MPAKSATTKRAAKITSDEATLPARIRDVREALSGLRALRPLETLESARGTEFGRHISDRVSQLRESGTPLSLHVHRRPSAVVLTAESYRQLLAALSAAEALAEAAQGHALEQEGGAFDALYARIGAPASRAAADALFDRDTAELARHHRPGETERGQ